MSCQTVNRFVVRAALITAGHFLASFE
jgi:hypothetical protein